MKRHARPQPPRRIASHKSHYVKFTHGQPAAILVVHCNTSFFNEIWLLIRNLCFISRHPRPYFAYPKEPASVMVFGTSTHPLPHMHFKAMTLSLYLIWLQVVREPRPFHANTSIHQGSGSCLYALSSQRNAVRRLSSLSPFASFRSCGHSACSMFRHSLRSLISPSSFASSQHPLFALPHFQRHSLSQPRFISGVPTHAWAPGPPCSLNKILLDMKIGSGL